MSKEIIYISAHLGNTIFGKPVVAQLKKELEPRGYTIIEIEKHNNNDWSRDFLPVKASNGKLVKFIYAPIYLTEAIKWKKTIPDVKQILSDLEIEDYSDSDLKLDGGAIEVFGDQAIVSDRVLRENIDKFSIDETLAKIKEKLALKRLIVVPEYPDDFTGHVDGIARFIDVNTVLVNAESPDNEYELNRYKKKMHTNWYYSFHSVFKNMGIKTETIPYTFYKDEKGKDCLGLYTNFLKLDELIVMPEYKMPEDDKASEILQRLYERPVIRIDSRELAKKGGMINCVTWEKK
jgi:agmatine deiminase